MATHHRSKQAQTERWEQHQQHVSSLTERQLANDIVLDFSLYCKENGDKVFAQETEPIVRAKLTNTFGHLPISAMNRDYGEVLNRFPHTVFPLEVKWSDRR